MDKSIVGIQGTDNGAAKDAAGMNVSKLVRSIRSASGIHLQGISHEIVAEPGQRSSQHRNPVFLQDQQVRNVLFHGMLAVLGAVDETESEEQQNYWKNESKSKGNTPNTIVDLLVVCSKHDPTSMSA